MDNKRSLNPTHYEAAKHFVLFGLHSNIDTWFKLVGKMFEATHGFIHAGMVDFRADGSNFTLRSDAHGWSIREL